MSLCPFPPHRVPGWCQAGRRWLTKPRADASSRSGFGARLSPCCPGAAAERLVAPDRAGTVGAGPARHRPDSPPGALRSGQGVRLRDSADTPLTGRSVTRLAAGSTYGAAEKPGWRPPRILRSLVGNSFEPPSRDPEKGSLGKAVRRRVEREIGTEGEGPPSPGQGDHRDDRGRADHTGEPDAVGTEAARTSDPDPLRRAYRTVSTMAAYGVETASGMMAAWPKGRSSGRAIRASSRATAHSAQPPS